MAVVDQGRQLNSLPNYDAAHFMPAIYSLPSSDFRDIVSGTNGYPAQPGYDLATGRGSPIANLLVPALAGTAQVSGQVFNDANANGVLDNGEVGLSGWTVYEDLNGNQAFDPQTTTTVNSTDTPKAISNGATVVSSLPVSGLTGNIVDVNVTVNISDAHDGDLTINLISPSGTVITLADRVGGSNGQNFSGTIFDDQASEYISAGVASFSGSYAPIGSLSSLVGTNPNSATPWKLQIINHSSSHTGTLTSWSLQFKTGDISTTTAANGSYYFSGMVPGSYQIADIVQPPYAPTSPSSGSFSVSLVAGQSVSGENFGNHASISATPTAITLAAASDTGISNSDGITRLNNNGPAAELQFQVAGTVAGAAVSVYADSTLIGSATAAGATTLVTTNGTLTLGDRISLDHGDTTRAGQIRLGESPGLVDQDRHGRAAALDRAGAARSALEPGVANDDFVQRSGKRPRLDRPATDVQRRARPTCWAAQSVTTADGGATWTLNDLSSLTSVGGSYELDVLSSGTPVDRHRRKCRQHHGQHDIRRRPGRAGHRFERASLGDGFYQPVDAISERFTLPTRLPPRSPTAIRSVSPDSRRPSPARASATR